ncbi:hypothetical protein HALA3H3_990007 [Halomonas sp. A3H3]|uniref:hypothetical protein n=1 Tax=Halomonas sp. A3H3 TaxID=1346287 RepID=UPI00038D9D45|nr:hypothetical protein [Halomonas sp. A3H3]CDG56003.1 hypothetical protein HALA3H3_990007 [Halomonas sp. A3H3]|tara:strand:+ start:5932 stop:7200 length:1269 start_codon:yes stop_codon:yes gene_type:complete
MSQMHEVRSLERWKDYKNVVLDYDDFLELSSLEGEKLYSLNVKNKFLDLLVRIKKGAPIVILFHGAVPRPEGFKAPVFSGLNIVDDSFSRILISDPCLLESDELTLGWFCGTKDIPLQKLLPAVLKKIFDISNPSKIIFAGGSGGGFASLFYSSFFKNSYVIASNPQIDITNYYSNHVKRYAHHSWRSDIKDLNEYITKDVSDLYAQHSNTVLYIQNESDSFHIENHCKPFLEKIAGNKGFEKKERLINCYFYYKIAYWGDGHVGPPPIYWKSLIKYLALYDGESDQVFKSQKFYDLLSEAEAAHIDALEERAHENYSKGELEKALLLLKRYFKTVDIPSVRMCILSLNLSYKLRDELLLDYYFECSKKYYPNGWALGYCYSLNMKRLGNFSKAIEALENINIVFKEKVPQPVIDMLKKLKG